MSRLIASRVVQGALALLFLSVVIFSMSRATGDIRDIILPADATQEDWDRVGKVLGLDRPLHEQYGLFLFNALRGDLGFSYLSRERVTTLLWERAQSSAKLGVAAVLIVLAVGIPAGVFAGVYRGTLVDSGVKFLALFGMSFPSFWAGIVLIQLFAVWLRWLPAGTDQGFTAIILPAVTLALTGLAGVARLLRSAMLEVLDSEFVKLARAKGISETAVIWKHALKNALGPVVAYASILFVIMLTLAMTVEVVFAWPGIGQLTYNSILRRDFPVIQGVVLLAATTSIVVSTLADILYVYLDPRIRL